MESQGTINYRTENKSHRLKIWETFTDTTLDELIQSMK